MVIVRSTVSEHRRRIPPLPPPMAASCLPHTPSPPATRAPLVADLPTLTFPPDTPRPSPPTEVVVCKQSIPRDLPNCIFFNVDRQWCKRETGRPSPLAPPFYPQPMRSRVPPSMS
ncbi:hypothetical protein HYPSUDRAFT_72228 [Hypholoma sublateritium FD-334 SS-4]|uniref:Uncharacterized protein n=1 Tax=Hypholoma sublateritium (strain FD-334 SS-4) TaxID=945553 RepID=A0A0D2LWA1_HYPSF|nr:hypothetical protein HYPSUDRAFT_72228 [Hypholoma sublateritium FD-334 SS-4]